MSELPVDKEKLFELYKMALETDRYELELGWKLVQFFTLLNSGLLTLAFTILGSGQLTSKYFVTPIFVLGILCSIIAILARRRYHRHSLQAEYKRTLIENELGLYTPFSREGYAKHTLAISTSSKLDRQREILKDPEKWIKKRTLKVKTVPFYHAMIFVFFTIANLVGLAIILGPDVITALDSACKCIP